MFRLLLAAIFCASTTVHAADTFTFSSRPGPHGVGVKFVQQYDRTRVYKTDLDLVTGEQVVGERARPIQTVVWYPAVRGGKPVVYRDYLETMATEDDFTRSVADVKRMTDARIEDNVGDRRDALLRDIALPMQAVNNAGALEAKFPVVIYAPSYSASAVENADLCEYLASHGYVVLSSASLGARTRSMTVNLDGVETQAADISYLIGYAGTLPQVDTSKVAVIGFSWGGLANVFAAARDRRIKALVSLDGSLRGYAKLIDGGKDAAKYVTPARAAVPLLYLGARPKTIEQLSREETGTRYSFMNEMKYSDVYIVSMLQMTHADFSSYALRISPDNDFGDFTRADVMLSHSWAALYTRHFLDAYLKNNATGLAFINNTPRANGMPAHAISTDIRRKKEAAPPTLESFVQRLAIEGFEKSIEVHDRFLAKNAEFKLDSNDIYGWGTQLKRLSQFVKAREIFRLGTHLYPDLSFMHAALAETQAKTQQTQHALKSYRRTLELDPENADARKYLKKYSARQDVAAP